MHFARSEEQDLLATTVRDLLARHCDSAAVRAAMASPLGYDVQLWQLLCEQIGVAALAVPEEQGGVGASLVETAVVLEEVGANLAPTPLLSSALHTARLLLRPDGGEDLQALAGGAVRPFSLGSVVLDPDSPTGTLDPTLRLGPGDDTTVPAELLDVAASLVSALLVGAMQRGLDMTVAYAKQRHQFGRPIAAFQAVQHRLANAATAALAARLLLWEVVSRPEGGGIDPRRLKAWIAEAVFEVAKTAHMLHGGIGVVDDHEVSLIYRRAQGEAMLYGSPHELWVER